MMPCNINCFCAGETSGIPRMAAQFQAVWKHLDLGHGVEGMYLQGDHLEKETASRCVWAKKMLLKCNLSLCCAALQVLRKCLGAGESEAAAVGELWVQMCLQMCSLWLVRVSHCFLSYQPSHSVLSISSRCGSALQKQGCVALGSCAPWVSLLSTAWDSLFCRVSIV